MNEFNPQVNLDSLPDVRDLVFVNLEPDYLKVLLIRRTITAIVLLGLVLAFYIFKPFDDFPKLAYVLIIVTAIIYIAWSFFVTVKGFQYKAYALRDKDIIYKSGWLWRYMITTPFNRVQHVQLDQGPVERKFNVSKLKVFTAGGGTGDLVIPGIRLETANELKEFIVRKTEHGEEE